MTADSAHDVLHTLHEAALAGMLKGPKKLASAVAFHAADEAPPGADWSETAFREQLATAHSNAPLLWLWRKQLAAWDADATAHTSWTTSRPRTELRRAAAYERLGLAEETRKLLDTRMPFLTDSAPVVISHEFTPWRNTASFPVHNWYWPGYARHLTAGGRSPEVVVGIDDAAERVVERLANPTAEVAYQSRGLVVGHVQSGKTANFTGVIAKAVDAGYRLVIVLGGTLNLLRAQTQRRLDMELVGRENILCGAPEGDSEYADDPAWAKGSFLSHGDRPSALEAFDIIRLTTRDDDYKSLAQGIAALHFERHEKTLPLYDPQNLHRSNARLMVVKKNKTVLTKLVKDLRKISGILPEIPTLIIDDESDEASVNTTSPRRRDATRTAINQQISTLLKMLPRAQYVGYTATPFANVFVDPADSEDIFPKDFIISLPRPEGYMGVRDFHDLDSPVPPEERTVANSNELAHVRTIAVPQDEEEDDDSSLREALDMFVLTAAMKIYRETSGPEPLGLGHYGHHTMLVHESRLQDDHRALNARIVRLWEDGGYAGSAGHERLRALFDRDVAPVSAVRNEGFAVPASYDDLKQHIGAAWMRIGGSESPVIVVNGDKDIEAGTADFDRRGIWKILIGGQKLSRGFTVEGLTVSYYRRKAGNASTMMQMGRWFGFRRGYRDLVRLYISRSERQGKQDLDLYEAFEALCRDEESFREQLEQYAVTVDGRPQVTPAQVPPLVYQHLPWLPPTSRNKMYNAKLAEIGAPGVPAEPTAYPTSPADLRHNSALWRPVVEELSADPVLLGHTRPDARPVQYRALLGRLDAPAALDLMRSLKWSAPRQFAPHLAYVESLTRKGEVEDWLVVVPQLVDDSARITFGGRTLSWHSRRRRRESVFSGISDPKHRDPLLRIAGALPGSGHPDTDALVRHGRGVISLYPVIEREHQQAVEDGVIDPGKLVMAFTFVSPAGSTIGNGRAVRFTTIDSSREDDPIIDATR
jgi:hypothetical protein